MVGGGGRFAGGGGRSSPFSRPLGGLPWQEPQTGPQGRGQGGLGYPNIYTSNDRYDTLIILRYVSWENLFSTLFHLGRFLSHDWSLGVVLVVAGVICRSLPPTPLCIQVVHHLPRCVSVGMRSVGLVFLHGALDSHLFFPSRAASGHCVLTAAAARVACGVVSAVPAAPPPHHHHHLECSLADHAPDAVIKHPAPLRGAAGGGGRSERAALDKAPALCVPPRGSVLGLLLLTLALHHHPVPLQVHLQESGDKGSGSRPMPSVAWTALAVQFVQGGGGKAVKRKMKKCGKMRKKCGKMRENAAKKSDDPNITTSCIACGFLATQLPSDQVLGPRPQTH